MLALVISLELANQCNELYSPVPIAVRLIQKFWCIFGPPDRDVMCMFLHIIHEYLLYVGPKMRYNGLNTLIAIRQQILRYTRYSIWCNFEPPGIICFYYIIMHEMSQKRYCFIITCVPIVQCVQCLIVTRQVPTHNHVMAEGPMAVQ